METFLITFSAFVLAVAAMAVGVIFAKKPLKGSCGGLNQLRTRRGEEGSCELCGDDDRRRPKSCQRVGTARRTVTDPLL